MTEGLTQEQYDQLYDSTKRTIENVANLWAMDLGITRPVNELIEIDVDLNVTDGVLDTGIMAHPITTRVDLEAIVLAWTLPPLLHALALVNATEQQKEQQQFTII